MAATKTFETSFRLGAKYTGGPAFKKLHADLGKTQRYAQTATDGFKKLHSHIGKFAIAVGATAAAYKLLSAATALWREGVEASKEAIDIQEKLEMTAVRLSKRYGESSQKLVDSANATSKAISKIGFDFEDVQAGVTTLMASMGNTRQLQSFSQAFANITAKVKGARPGLEGWRESAEAINLAILTGRSPLLKQLDWTDKQIKVFKKLSEVERQAVLESWGRIRLAGEAVRASETTSGALGKEAIAREDLASALAGDTMEQQQKRAEAMAKFYKALLPVAKVVGAKIAEFFERWTKIMDEHGPEIVKNVEKVVDILLKIPERAGELFNWLKWWDDLNLTIIDLPKLISNTLKEWEWLTAALKNDWETIKAVWKAAGPFFKELWAGIVTWFDDNVIKKIAALWDWLIGNSYMVEGTERGWERIKSIWSLWADWFWAHVANPIAKMWGVITPGVSAVGMGAAWQHRIPQASDFKGSGGGTGVTSAGGGLPGSTGPNAEIAAERAAVMAELQDPATRKLVAATLAQEMGSTSGRADVLESLVNRAVVKKRSLRSLIRSGFYGPYNRGDVGRALRRGMSPAAMAEFDAIAAEVGAGRNRIKGRIDQGRPREVAARGRMMSEGEAYGFWNMARESNTAAFRAGQAVTQTKMIKERSKSSTPYSPINPYSGQPGLRGPAILSPSASLRGMTRGMNMQQRMSGQSPTSISMNSPINFHGSTTATPEAIAEKVSAALRNSSRDLLAGLKKSRGDEQRLNFDFA